RARGGGRAPPRGWRRRHQAHARPRSARLAAASSVASGRCVGKHSMPCRKYFSTQGATRMESRQPPLSFEELDERVLPSVHLSGGPFRDFGGQVHHHHPHHGRHPGQHHNHHAAPQTTPPQTGHHPGQHHNPHAAHHHHGHHAHGGASGTYTASAVSGDLGKTFTLTGQATVPGLGSVPVTGSIHTIGNILQGRAAGQL